MFKIKKQLYCIWALSGLNSFQIAGASWVALLAARGFSLVEIGLAESCFHITMLLFEIPSGVISDVFGRKKSMILSQCMFILSALCMAFSTDFFTVCIALTLDALGFTFESGAREALAYDSLKSIGKEEQYITFSATDLAIYRIGNASAILCAGVALTIGYRVAYLIDVVTGVLCLLLALQLKEIQVETGQFEGSITARITQCFKESFYFLTHNLRSIGLMLWNAVIGSIATLNCFFLQAKLPLHGISDFWLGPSMFFISLGGAIGARLVTKTSKIAYDKLSFLCITSIVLGTAGSLTGWSLMMCMGGFLANLCDDLLQVRTDALLNDRFQSSQRATLNSVVSQTFSVVMIVLSPLAGWIFSM